jgi:hypothetical protein
MTSSIICVINGAKAQWHRGIKFHKPLFSYNLYFIVIQNNFTSVLLNFALSEVSLIRISPLLPLRSEPCALHPASCILYPEPSPHNPFNHILLQLVIRRVTQEHIDKV